jgi:Stress responsive A/B Barrel Domain
MLRHTVFFRLRHPVGSAAEQDFLAAADVLSAIPEVRHFEKVRQVSAKNAFAFGFLFTFADEAAHRAYQANPLHDRFVQERWIPEVEEFLEIDHEALA